MKGDMPFTSQQRFPKPGSDLGEGTAIPHDPQFDLDPVESRTRIGYYGDECTFKAPKNGGAL